MNSQLSELAAYKDEVAARVRRGDSLDDIDEQIINPSPFPDEMKAALWLYGWSLQSRRRQRRIALEALVHASRVLA